MSYEEVEDLYPLSPMQQGMLFSSLLVPHAGVYVEQRLCSLHGALNVSAFERAWQQVADRHAVMRTSVVWEGGEQPVQVVHTQAELPLEVYPNGLAAEPLLVTISSNGFTKRLRMSRAGLVQAQ